MILLESIEVWNWRGLEHLKLADLAPDLNLIVGPNESGKSRLVQALHHAFFERYKGTGYGKSDLQSWDSGEPPEVQVVFRAGGQRWSLRKRFLKREQALLEGAGGTLRDDDAEARVQALLGTRSTQRKVTADQLGIWPLLWLPQGQSGQAPQTHLNDDGRAALRDALSTEVDLVATGPLGQHVLERIAQEYSRYYTPKTAQPTGELRQAIEAVDAAQASHEHALQKRQDARDLADELALVLTTLSELAPRLTLRREARRAAQERLRKAAELQHAHEVQQARTDTLRAQADRLEDALASHLRAKSEIQALQQRIAQREHTVTELQVALTQAEAALEQASTLAQQREQAEQLAEQQIRAGHGQRRRQDLERAVHRTQTAWDRASQIHADLRQALTQRDACVIRPLEVVELQNAERAHLLAKARAEAAAVRVTVNARADLQVEGAALAAGHQATFLVSEPRTLRVTDLLDLEITPGEGNHDALRDDVVDTERQLGRLLGKYGVPDVEGAQQRLAQHQQAQDRVHHLQDRLADHAPKGMDSLDHERKQAANALQDLLGTVPQGNLSLPMASAATEPAIDLAAAEAAFEQARIELARARGQRDAAREQRSQAREAHTLAESELSSLKATLAQHLHAFHAVGTDDLRSQRDAQLDAWSRAHQLSQSLKRQYEQAGGDDAQADLQRSEQALASLEAQHAEAEKRSKELQVTLQVLGNERLHEQVQETSTALDQARAQHARVLRRALAAARLRDAVEAARTRTQDLLVAPVRERVAPYLAQVFPHSQLHVDAEWQVLGLKTGSITEQFDQLSGGAREQLSVLVRLGLAEVLSQGSRIPVVLDDALVNTDMGRLDTMMRVLFRASRSLQVLVFSCHDADFDALGASRVHRLSRRERALVTLPAAVSQPGL